MEVKCNVCCPIYVVNEKFFECVKLAIISVKETIERPRHKGLVKAFFHGYVTDEKWKNELKQYESENLSVKFNEKNYGKPYVINEIVKNNESQYILSFDHDMQIKDEHKEDFFARMINTYHNAWKQNIKVGFLANEIEKMNIHLNSAYTNKIQLSDEVICHGPLSQNTNDVAGSSVLILREHFLGVGGYRQYNLFDGDGWLRMDIRKKYGTLNAIHLTLPVIHNHPEDKEYHEWKVHNSRHPSLNVGVQHDKDALTKLKGYGDE
jgi:glycosyltransferase involved in cell wall biosynthesis